MKTNIIGTEEYRITDDHGKLFCMCDKSGEDAVLNGANGRTITVTNLIKQITNFPKQNKKGRGK